MPKFLQTIWADIKAHKNLELYLIMFSIILIYIADIFGLETETLLMEIVLAVLAVLAYGLLEDRRSQERIEALLHKATIGQSATEFFKHWNDDAFREELKTAHAISLLAIANQVFLSQTLELLKQFLARGGTLRCILVEPEGHAMPMVAALAVGYQRHSHHVATQVNLSIAQLRDLAALAGPERVQLKLVDFLPQAVITILEQPNAEGHMFVTLYGFNQPFSARPSFAMRKSKDRQWFAFYQEAYENLWNWEKSQPIDLVEP